MQQPIFCTHGTASLLYIGYIFDDIYIYIGALNVDTIYVFIHVENKQQMKYLEKIKPHFCQLDIGYMMKQYSMVLKE